MSSENRLLEIRQEIMNCQRCPLAKGRLNAVPGEGPAKVDILFIGEAPGFHEDRQAKPFVGQSGQFLTSLIEAAGLKREQVFITNVVKCRPPNNRDPLPEELSACQLYLDEQIALLQPKVIVTLGRISMSKFIEGGRISAIHGRTHNIGGQKVVTMYHPAAALHQPALRQTLLEDFSKLKNFISIEENIESTPRPETQIQSKDSSEIKTSPSNSEDDKPAEQLSLF